jgi:hypothetical protein
MCSPSLAPTQPSEVDHRDRHTTAGWGGERWTLQQGEGVVHLLQGPVVPTTVSSSRHTMIFDSIRGRLIVITASLYRRDDPYRHRGRLNQRPSTPPLKLFAVITISVRPHGDQQGADRCRDIENRHALVA